jgi:acylaminoacyl-peptidase
MRACSPIAHIENVHTPVLLLVGDSDRRVPPAQSIEYFRALRKLGRKVEMKVYAGQMHGLANLASMEADGIVNSLLWFEHH